MSLLFDRRVSLTFGLPGETGTKIDSLRIAFKIEKTSEPFPNKAEIRVWNMKESSRSLAERSGLALFLDAGYVSNTKGIFVGTDGRVLSSREGADIITTFEYGDGEKEFQTKTFDKSFSPSTPIRSIFSSVIEALGLSEGDTSGIKDETLLSGLTLSGPVRNHLDTLTARQGLEWSIQDGALQIIKRGGTVLNGIVELGAGTGLIGSPKKKDKGLEVTSLLMPELVPGRTLQLNSRFLQGDYRILKVTHQGDTHGREWYSICEIEPKSDSGSVQSSAGQSLSTAVIA